MANTPEMVNSVNAPILADSRITIEEISEQLEISIGVVYKTVHNDLVFSKLDFSRTV